MDQIGYNGFLVCPHLEHLQLAGNTLPRSLYLILLELGVQQRLWGGGVTVLVPGYYY